MTARFRIRRARGCPPVVPQARVLRGQLGAVSIRAAMGAGAWVGFALGLVLGSAIGALLCWFADAAVRWQHDLGLTLGVAQNLLPLGDQIGMLRTISHEWYLVIPIAALVSGAVWAVLAALVAGLITTAYNRASQHASVLVELPAAEIAALEAALIDETSAVARGELAGLAKLAQAPGAVPFSDRIRAIDGRRPAGADPDGTPSVSVESSSGEPAAEVESGERSSDAGASDDRTPERSEHARAS